MFEVLGQIALVILFLFLFTICVLAVILVFSVIDMALDPVRKKYWEYRLNK